MATYILPLPKMACDTLQVTSVTEASNHYLLSLPAYALESAGEGW